MILLPLRCGLLPEQAEAQRRHAHTEREGQQSHYKIAEALAGEQTGGHAAIVVRAGEARRDGRHRQRETEDRRKTGRRADR